MAPFTQYLNIIGVCSARWVTRMRFNVMPLQVICSFTLLTLFSFFNNLINCFSGRICSFTNSSFPKRMIFSSHELSTRFSQTRNGTIFSSAAITFSYLKRFFAIFTNTINKLTLFSWFNKLSAFTRTSVCFATIMTSK